MVESIKDIYNHIENLSYTSLNNYIGSLITPDILKYIEYNLIQNIFNYYPMLEISLNLTLNGNNVTSNIKIQSNSFPIMSHNNYKTHNFVEKYIENFEEYNYSSYYNVFTLKCQTCNISITESGSPIDGDFSCNEWIIKNIIE